VVFNTSEKLNNNLVNAWMATEAMQTWPSTQKTSQIDGPPWFFPQTEGHHNWPWGDKSRQERENSWIRTLKTLSPNGIKENQ
jgi:hypothetical protein